VAANPGYGAAIQALLDQMNANAPAVKPKYDLPSNFVDKAPGGVPSKNSGNNSSPNGKNESTFHKVLDFLGRGQAASAGAFLGGFHASNTNDHTGFGNYDFGKALKGFEAGISGETHHDFNEVLKEHGNTGIPGLGTALNIAADPLTYAGGIGLIGKAGKAIKAGDALIEGEGALQKASSVGKALIPHPINDVKAVAKGAKGIVGKLGDIGKGAVKAPAADIGSKLAALKALENVPQAAATAAKMAGPADSAIADLGKLAKSTSQLPKNLNSIPKIPKGVILDSKVQDSFDAAAKAIKNNNDTIKNLKSGNVLPSGKSVESDIADLKQEIAASKVAMHQALSDHAASLNATPVAAEASHVATPTAAAFASRTLNDLLPAERAELDAAVASKRMDLNRARFDKEFDQKGYHAELTSGDKKPPPFNPADAIKMKDIRSDPGLFNGIGSNLGVKDSIAYSKLNASTVNTLRAQELAKLNDVDRATHDAANSLAATPSVPTPTPPSPVESLLAAHPDPAGVAPSTAAMRVAATQAGLTPKELQIASANAQRFMGVIKAGDGGFNAAKQVNLRNSIAQDVMNTTKGGLKNKLNIEQQAKITRIYAHAEAMVEQGGHAAVLEDGTKARLSNILPHLTPEEIVKGDHLTQVMNGTATTDIGGALHQAMVAAAHVEDVNKVHPLIQDIANLVRNNGTVKAISAAATGTDSVVHAARMAEASPEAVNAVKQTLTDSVASELPHVEAVIKTKPLTEAATATNVPSFAAGKTQIEGVEKYLGIRIGTNTHEVAMIPLLPATKIVKGAKAVLGLGERDSLGRLTARQGDALTGLSARIARVDHVFRTGFSTAYNKPVGYAEAANRSINATGAHVLDAMNDLSKFRSETTLEQRALGFEKAKAGDLTDPAAAAIHDRMDNLFGPSGLLRNAGITPDELLPEMQRAFKGLSPESLKAIIPMDATDASIGGELAHPYDSWIHGTAPVGTKWEDPASMMLGLEAAAQKATGRAQLLNHAGTTLGMDVAKAPEDWQLVKVRGGRLDDVRFPPDIAPRMQELLTQTGGAKGDDFWRGYDKLLRGYKISLTKYFPGHHVNNSIGQTMMAYQADGLTNFNWYRKAMHVVRDHAPVEPGGIGMSGEAADMGKMALNFKGQPVSNEQAWRLFTNSGARQAFAATNELGAETPSLMGGISQSVQHFSDARENMHRLGHFMFLINKDTKSGSLVEAANAAGARVNQIHANYTDITDFEKNVMRRLVPFYTWQRKVTPIMFKQTFTDPGRVIAIPKIYAGISGQPSNGQGFFPSPAELVPSYMQDLLQIDLPGGIGGPRSPYGDTVGKILNRPGSLIDSVTPAIKVPIELKTGRSLFSGGPIPDKTTYIGDQLPVVSTLQQLTRHNVLGETTKDPLKKPDQQGFDINALLNKLTGVPIKPVTSSITAAAQKEQNGKQSPGLARVAKVGKIRVAR
jgi:hypothetical protein